MPKTRAVLGDFPDVRGALTGGADEAEALEMARDALGVALAGYALAGWDIPAPSPASTSYPCRPLVAAKRALYSAMREQGVSEAALGQRLGIGDEAVRKLVNPDYGSHTSQVLKALRAVGRTLIVEDAAPTTPCPAPDAALARS